MVKPFANQAVIQSQNSSVSSPSLQVWLPSFFGSSVLTLAVAAPEQRSSGSQAKSSWLVINICSSGFRSGAVASVPSTQFVNEPSFLESNQAFLLCPCHGRSGLGATFAARHGTSSRRLIFLSSFAVTSCAVAAVPLTLAGHALLSGRLIDIWLATALDTVAYGQIL